MKQALEFNKVKEQLSSEKLTILGINTSGDSKASVVNYLKGFPESVKFSYLLDPDQSVHKNYSQGICQQSWLLTPRESFRPGYPGWEQISWLSFLKSFCKKVPA